MLNKIKNDAYTARKNKNKIISSLSKIFENTPSIVAVN